MVLLRNPRLKSSRAFFSIGVFVSLWAVSNYFTGLRHDKLIWNSIANSAAFFSAFLAVVSVVWFSYNFPVKSQIRSVWRVLLPVNVATIAVLSVLPIMAGRVSLQNGELHFSVGVLLPLYVAEVLFLLVVALRNFIRVYGKYRGRERQQVLYVLVGLSMPILLGLLTNAVIPSFTSSWQTASFGPVLTVFLVGTIAASIIRHRLFDLRLAVARSLTYSLSILAVVAMFMAVAFGLSRLVFGFTLAFGQELLLASFSALAALLFQPVKRFFDRMTNKFFYRDAYNAQELFNAFNQALVASVELEKLLAAATNVISKNLKAEFCYIALGGSDLYSPRVVGTSDVTFTKDDIQKGERLLRHIDARIIVTDDLEIGDPLRPILVRNGTGVMAQLKDGENLGYLILGNKRSGNPYNSQDVHVIEALTDELVIAIQNSLRFEEIERFNDTLQQKIEDATRKLRRTNDKLRLLDQTKDDFISMASHQLRTPLTSVKGYVSMVLDGDAGQVSPLQRKLLNQAFISAQRMVYLISDLLNVSRLRTGKFVIEPVPTNLTRVIKDEVDQLIETAKGRNLQLTFNRPEHFPTLMLDETKMRQVIMNFIDNAIYYTPSGGHIAVSLVDKPSSIEFSVTDDGIGVPRAEQHHLFTKFFRAHNAKRARPDGTGLGLFMAKKVVVAQGGAITFRSQENKGSTFGFTFAKDKLQAQNAGAQQVQLKD